MKARATLFAVLAAACYALSSPLAKLLLNDIFEVLLAGLLYLGAGISMVLISLAQRGLGIVTNEEPLGRSERKYVIAMVVLDILAPILLLIGLKTSAAANVSLLNNFEIVATTLIAWLVFSEVISKKLALAIGLITLATVVLSFQPGSLHFSTGSLFVLLASLCWGLENNCTRMISSKDTKQIVMIKGFGSGLGSLSLGFLIADRLPGLTIVGLAILLGFVAYGLSVYLYVKAQRYLGAAKTSAYYAIAPFLGAGFSIFLLREMPGLNFMLALLLMLVGTYFTNRG